MQERLTAKQIRAIQVAHEMGYYSVPRECTASEVANELDISGQAVSERLRRANLKLVVRELENEG